MTDIEAGTEPIQTQKPPISWINREPVALQYIIQTGIAMAIGFGLGITPEQMALVLAFTGAVLTWITHQNVTPFVASGTTPTVDDPSKTPLIAPNKQ